MGFIQIMLARLKLNNRNIVETAFIVIFVTVKRSLKQCQHQLNHYNINFN